jgi:hypothetical protein
MSAKGRQLIMISHRELTRQIRLAGFHNTLIGWSAIRQLPVLLDDNEVIQRVVSGLYEGGHGVLVATDKRMIFLDKKIMSCRIEDVHYDMVSDVEHFLGILTARIKVHCISGTIELTSLSHHQVRAMAVFVDARINELRQSRAIWAQMTQQQIPTQAHSVFQTAAPQRTYIDSRRGLF